MKNNKNGDKVRNQSKLLPFDDDIEREVSDKKWDFDVICWNQPDLWDLHLLFRQYLNRISSGDNNLNWAQLVRKQERNSINFVKCVTNKNYPKQTLSHKM